MSALPPEADMLIVGINVCYVPITEIPDEEDAAGKYTMRFARARGDCETGLQDFGSGDEAASG